MSTPASLLEELKSTFSDQIYSITEEYDIHVVEVNTNSTYDILKYIKDDSSAKLNFLTTLCAIHYPAQSGKELGVMYQLKNILTNDSIRIKAYIPIQNPEIRSVVSIFPTANWMERQEYDFFGVQFVGHPDLRRILNMDDMDYFPMRKEYKMEDATRDDKEDKYFGRN